MNTVSIPASSLKIGDVLVEHCQRWRVDTVETNPRRKYNNIEGDVLVDVDATGVGFRVPCSRFSSYSPSALVTIEVNQ